MPHKLGILFVHGIGEQPEGETLLGFGDPLLKWLGRWISTRPDRGPKGTVTTLSSELEPSRTRSLVPPHAVVEIRAGDDASGRVQTWLLAECWWGGEVRRPPFGKLARWMLTTGAWMILSQAFRRGVRRDDQPSAGQSLRQRSVHAAVRALRIARALVLSLLITPLVELAIVVLAAIGTLPIPRLRSALSGFIVRFSGILGDSFVLLDSELQRAAILSKARRDLDWIAARCDTVVVVAHSQGAAVAHRLLRDPSPANVSALITFGSGLAKLEELELMTARHPDQLRFAHLGIPFTVLAAVIAARILLAHRGDSWSLLALMWGFFPLILLILAVNMVVGDSSGFLERLKGLSLKTVRPTLRWLDVYTADDPVPNGPLSRPGARVDGLRSRRIVNRGSVVRDHTAYWANRVSFIPRLVAWLDHHAGLGLFSGPAGRSARRHLADCVKRHDVQVRWLVAFRWAGVTSAALAVVGLWPHLADLGRHVLAMMGEAPFEAIGKLVIGIGHLLARPIMALSGVSPDALERLGLTLVGAALPVGLIVLWGRIAALAWDWWEGRLTNQIFEPAAFPSAPADRMFLGALVVAVGLLPLVVVIMLLIGPRFLSFSTVEAGVYQVLGGAFVLLYWFIVVAAIVRGIARRNDVPVSEWLLPAIVGPLFGLMMTPLPFALPLLPTLKEMATALLVAGMLILTGFRAHVRLVSRAESLIGAHWAQAGALAIAVSALLLVFVGRPGVATLPERVLSAIAAYFVLNVLARGVLRLVAWRRQPD